jgi:uncharacterized SAM-binding protein YcdF (DUF218 family)
MIAFAEAIADLVTLPLQLAAMLGVFAVVAAVVGTRRLGAALVACAALVAYAGAIPLVGEALLRPLENRYPPLAAPPVDAVAVVVLGSSYRPQPGVSLAAALDPAALVRILDGVAWARRLEAARLVVSGGAPPGRAPTAQGYAALAAELGIAPGRVVAIDRPLDTAGEALAVAELLGDRPFLLVTSAYHMPRAVRLMRRAGAAPIPAPTEQRLEAGKGIRWGDFVPRADGLADTEAALHEYLGLLAVALGLD